MTTAEIGTRVAIKNIFCAVDLTAVSETILDYAGLIAHTYGSKIYIAHVVPHPDPTSPPVEMMRPDQHPLTRGAHYQLAQLVARPGAPLTHSEILMGRGLAPATVLLGMIAKRPIDLVVLGTSGRTGWDKFMLGSVAEKIFQQASCPVLTVGPQALNRPVPAKLRRILYPTDLSLESRAGLPLALSLAQEYEASLTMLFLVHPDIQSPEERHRLQGLYESQLRAMVPHDGGHSCRMEYVVDFDVRARGIIRIANERDADLVVLGVRGPTALTGLMSHLPGPTAYHVVAGAPCPVLTVRSEQA
jgi:nucleotide-binding universal stress UspA family protein